MSLTPDNETAYGPDQDREPSRPTETTWQEAVNRNPDDFDADLDVEEGTDVPASAGIEGCETDGGPDTWER